MNREESPSVARKLGQPLGGGESSILATKAIIRGTRTRLFLTSPEKQNKTSHSEKNLLMQNGVSSNCIIALQQETNEDLNRGDR